MTIDTPLIQLSLAAAERKSTPAILPLLTGLLFADKSLSFWHDLKASTRGLLSEPHAAHQLSKLTNPLNAIGTLLRRADDLEGTPLSTTLRTILKTIEAHEPLFYLPGATPQERIERLPLFAPLAILHLSIMGLFNTLTAPLNSPMPIPFQRTYDTTALRYVDWAQNAVSDAITWRTDQLQVSCTPTHQEIQGGPNLNILCTDTHTRQTIVNETCPAYPGSTNPLLLRTMDRITLYEERLYHKACLFWETGVLDVLSPWTKTDQKRQRPAPPNCIEAPLDDGLYMIMQQMGSPLTVQA